MAVKKIFLITFILLVTFTFSVFAANQLLYNGYTIAGLKVDNQLVTVPNTDVPAIVMDGRVMVPIRLAGELLGAEVQWDDVTKTVIINKPTPETAEPAVEIKKELIKLSGVSFNSTGTTVKGNIENNNRVSVEVKFSIDFYDQSKYLGHVHGFMGRVGPRNSETFTLDATEDLKTYTRYELTVDEVTKD